MKFEAFKTELLNAKTEEAVKATYAKYFTLQYDTSQHHDLYTKRVLFEFKTERNFKNLKALATTLAQSLYYIQRLKYSDATKPIPPYICLADKNEAVLTETSVWSTYYSNVSYDWERAASKPDQKLIDHLVKDPETSRIHVYSVISKQDHESFSNRLNAALNAQMTLAFSDKKMIDEENFEAAFDHWNIHVGKHIANGYKPSLYFLANLQEDHIVVDKDRNLVVFRFEDKNSKTQKVLMKDYEHFWGLYDHVTNTDTIEGIHTKLDRLTDENQRRLEGEFYTPLPFAKKAIHYWNTLLGVNWHKTGRYRIWDMAAGTGNLEYDLPAESYKYLYLSTLHASETDHLEKVFPNATCFQYDYLNDDVDYVFAKEKLPFEPSWKLPKRLRDDLKDQSLTWLVHINPPFATAQVGGATGDSKKGVSKTKVEAEMDRENTGHAKRELFLQFMFRISREMPKKTLLGMFSKLKYLNAPDSAEYRDKFFNYKYEAGFLFESTAFHGVKGKYPIGFLIWNLSKPRNQDAIDIDISDKNARTVGLKHLRLTGKNDVLNKWFLRPANSKACVLPPLSNGITVSHDNVDTRHRARPDFLASICSKGNDFQNSKYVSMLSSPSASAGAFSVNAETFVKALTIHAVRKIPRPTWLNDRNQFLAPHTPPPEEFLHDCVAWSLFASSNETTSLKDVAYQNQIYHIKNNFFPFIIREMRDWEVSDPEIKSQLIHDQDRFVAKWIETHSMSIASKKLFDKGREVYRIFYAKLFDMDTKPFRISAWDAGWYQIRRCLNRHNFGTDELKSLALCHRELGEKILPLIESLGFLDRDEVFSA